MLYVGAATGMEAKIAQAAGIEFAGITAGKLRRYHKAKLQHRLFDLSTLGLNLHDSFRVIKGTFQSLKILGQFEPDVVFIKGGYVGLPVGLAARWRRIPMVIHESDTTPGLTNRILGRWATKIAVGWPTDKYRDWPADKLVYIGSPVRHETVSARPGQAWAHFKLSAQLPLVLVMGGSQGAKAINDAVIDALPQLLARWQVIHVTGERDIERMKFEFRRLHLEPGLEDRYRAYSFLSDDLGSALAAANVVISRAGANSLAELAILAKPTILIPNHRLTGGHQISNASVLARSGAVRVINEDRLTPASLEREIKLILDSPSEQEILARGIARFAKPQAAAELAKLIRGAAAPEGKSS